MTRRALRLDSAPRRLELWLGVKDERGLEHALRRLDVDVRAIRRERKGG